MDKSLQHQLWQRGNVLMVQLTDIRLHIQNDLVRLMEDGHATKEMILDDINTVEKEYQWINLELRSWVTQMKAYMRYAANGGTEDTTGNDKPRTGRLFDDAIFGKGADSLDKHLDTIGAAKDETLYEAVDNILERTIELPEDEPGPDELHFESDIETW